MPDFTPQREPETLAARNRRAMAGGLPEGWLTPEQATDLMIPAAIEAAAGYAERTFLVTLDAAAMSGCAGVDWIERVTTSHVADMLVEAAEMADALQATPNQRQRLKAGRAALFDARLAELRAFAVLPWGLA